MHLQNKWVIRSKNAKYLGYDINNNNNNELNVRLLFLHLYVYSKLFHNNYK